MVYVILYLWCRMLWLVNTRAWSWDLWIMKILKVICLMYRVFYHHSIMVSSNINSFYPNVIFWQPSNENFCCECVMISHSSGFYCFCQENSAMYFLSHLLCNLQIGTFYWCLNLIPLSRLINCGFWFSCLQILGKDLSVFLILAFAVWAQNLPWC